MDEGLAFRVVADTGRQGIGGGGRSLGEWSGTPTDHQAVGVHGRSSAEVRGHPGEARTGVR
jgi:hypothetical protein